MSRRIFLSSVAACRSFADVCGLVSILVVGHSGITLHAESIRFRDVTLAAGLDFHHENGADEANPKKYFMETVGPGCAFWDFDGDGIVDIFVANGHALPAPSEQPPRDALFHNLADGRFEEISARVGIEAETVGYGMGCCIGDFNGDGFDDLYVTNYGRNALYQNIGGDALHDVTDKAKVGDQRWGTGCAFADYDLDGDLDVYVANYVDYSLEDSEDAFMPYISMENVEKLGPQLRKVKAYPHPDSFPGVDDVLYRNDGNGLFTEATREANLYNADGKGLGVVWGDCDNDGDLDLYVANDNAPNFLYLNDGAGSFVDNALIAGVGYGEDGRTEAGMGVDLGDYNNDQRLDIWVTNFQGEPNALYQNEGNGFFSNVSFPSAVGAASLRLLGWGGGFLDVDRDGYWDLFNTNSHVLDNIELFDELSSYAQPSLLLRNEGPRNGVYTFENVSGSAGGELAVARVGRGAAFGDYDNDGAVDILLASVSGPLTLLRNETATENNWLTVKLVGRGGNRAALGARVTVYTKGNLQMTEVKSGGSYLSQSDLRLNFGLGTSSYADSIRIRWPGGALETLRKVRANQILRFVENLNERGGMAR